MIFFFVGCYPITLEGRLGTTDEFGTIPFQRVLFSAAVVELAKSIPAMDFVSSTRAAIIW